jgi:3-deoxy-D-manno-octulosonate 8-phosphate phosphatase (KDO 8-P phosphatase)
MSKSIVVIPARYQSTRFPGKPLCMIDGIPMIQRVYEAAIQSKLANDVIVATDDERILSTVKGFNGNVIMTSGSHKTGTERVAEVAEKIVSDYYINVQGDEPFINPDNIDKVIGSFDYKNTQISSLYYKASYTEAQNYNRAKVVLNKKSEALYFSRSIIPFSYQLPEIEYYIHIGIYGYDREFLLNLKSLETSELEGFERLEQLGFLDNGYNIRMQETEKSGPSIDTPKDLERALEYLKTGDYPSEPDFKKIKMVITDVDGVLSPAKMIYSSQGEVSKIFNVRDGLGIKRLMNHGIKIAVITGRGSDVLKYRLEELGISEYHFKIENKAETYGNLIKKYDLQASEVIYVGDDLNDIPVFDKCGITFTVSDAPEVVKNKAMFVLNSRGGEGAIREISDRILDHY